MTEQRRIFRRSDNLELWNDSLEGQHENEGEDAARREHYRQRLKELLPELRKIDGFPHGTDEYILTLSDPPHYTACPNPFIQEFVQRHSKKYDPSTDTYRRQPFATDVSEGKTGNVYNAHSYHTKVPYKAIMRYILHYTNPGDIVFDGFCGTGMTGLAAQLCGNLNEISALGLRVSGNDIVDNNGNTYSAVGPRRCVLSDLSPAATFIAHNYNFPVSAPIYQECMAQLLAGFETAHRWMYTTLHEPTVDQRARAVERIRAGRRDLDSVTDNPWGKVNFFVWSDVFVCPACNTEVIFTDVALDMQSKKVRQHFNCSKCGTTLSKNQMEHAWTTRFDPALNKVVKQAKQVLALINYSVSGETFEKYPDSFDFELTKIIDEKPIDHWFPIVEMPPGEETKRNNRIGITHLHHFYTRRSLTTLSYAYSFLEGLDDPLRRYATFTVQQAALGLAKIARYAPTHYSQVNRYLSGTLYIGSQVVEVSLDYILGGKAQRLTRMLSQYQELPSNVITETCSATASSVPDDSVDYIFTDPPFGGNLQYSELNLFWESWLQVTTNTELEAVENKATGKDLPSYQGIMTRCFQEYYRVLKPGRWMTVEFHNSKNSVWNAIQEALQHAGFVVADVRTLDKGHGTFKQVMSAGAVKQDLIISAYRPRVAIENQFERESGTEHAVWMFVEQHLAQLPAFLETEGALENVAERRDFLLYDRMIAFHIQRGATIPMSAAEFYAGLKQRYPERDGMYFLPEQVAEYDRKRLEISEIQQLSFFVSDEQSAVNWLRQELHRQPQTYQDIQPKFLRELRQARHEKLPELTDMLNQNFLQEEQGRWYVPDPSRQADLEKLRERALLREFEQYASSKGKLKTFRTEAVRAGFKAAWAERDFGTIVSIAERLPINVLQEDPQLLMYYDNASARIE